jgi:hypothetical protein
MPAEIHSLGSQYNITTTIPNHATALHTSSCVALDDQVSASVNVKFLGDREPVTDRLVLLGSKTNLNDLNEVIRSKLGEWNCNPLALCYSRSTFPLPNFLHDIII